MKKWLPLLLIALLLLTGCTTAKEEQMTVSIAKLSEEETAIAKLLDGTGSANIYDYKADETLQSISINSYELIDGKWEPCIGGGTAAVTGAEGRFALDFDVLPDQLHVAFQDEEGMHSTTYAAPEKLDVSEMSRSTMRLDELSSFEYEEEIPLVAQIITRQNEIHSFTPDDVFGDPAKIAAYGHDHVYVVTVTFSQNPLN